MKATIEREPKREKENDDEKKIDDGIPVKYKYDLKTVSFKQKISDIEAIKRLLPNTLYEAVKNKQTAKRWRCVFFLLTQKQSSIYNQTTQKNTNEKEN